MSEERDDRPDWASELRQTAGREWAEEAAEDELLTELGRRRRLEFPDRARELVEQGRRVRVAVGAQTFAGQVVYAGTDYAVVDRGEDTVALPLTVGTWILEATAGPGGDQSGGSHTFRAYLSEIEVSGEQVRLALRGDKALLGFISLVGPDYAEVGQDGSMILVPIPQIEAVIRPRGR